MAHAQEAAFGLVITDLGMPHMDGTQVAAAIKSISSSTPILLLTGWGERLAARGAYCRTLRGS
jgi:YesN/AraC family two-component response regulator